MKKIIIVKFIQFILPGNSAQCQNYIQKHNRIRYAHS